MKIIINVLCLILSLGQQVLFPEFKSNLQSFSQGQWADCQTKEQQIAVLCDSMADQIYDCYLIPEGGLCSSNFSLGNASIVSIQESLYSLEESNVTLVFLDKINNLTSPSNEGTQTSTLNSQPNQTASIALFAQQGQTVFLKNIQVQTSNKPPNCKIANTTTYMCHQCDEDYTVYYGSCISASCIQYELNLIKSAITSSLNLIDDQLLLQLTFVSDLLQPNCFKIMVFLTQNFDDLTPLYLFSPERLSITDGQTLQLIILWGEISQIKCDHLVTFSQFVTQCYVNIAIVLDGQIQFQYLQQIRVYTDKQILTNIQLDGQQADTQDSDNQISVLSELILVEQVLQDETLSLTAIQYIREPRFINQTVIFESGTLLFDGEEFQLTLIDLQKNISDLSITYYLQVRLPQSVRDRLGQQQNGSISIVAHLQEPQKGRILMKRIPIEYYLENRINLQKSSSSSLQQSQSYQSSTGTLYPAIMIILFLFVLIQ